MAARRPHSAMWIAMHAYHQTRFGTHWQRLDTRSELKPTRCGCCTHAIYATVLWKAAVNQPVVFEQAREVACACERCPRSAPVLQNDHLQNPNADNKVSWGSVPSYCCCCYQRQCRYGYCCWTCIDDGAESDRSCLSRWHQHIIYRNSVSLTVFWGLTWS